MGIPTPAALETLTAKQLSELPGLRKVIVAYGVTGKMLATLLRCPNAPVCEPHVAAATSTEQRSTGPRTNYVLPPLIKEFESIRAQPAVKRIATRLLDIETGCGWHAQTAIAVEVDSLLSALSAEVHVFLASKGCAPPRAREDESESRTKAASPDLEFTSKLPLVANAGELAFRAVYAGLAQQLKDADGPGLRSLAEVLRRFPHGVQPKPRQRFTSLVELYAASASAKPAFDTIVGAAAGTAKATFLSAPLKHLLRSHIKSELRPPGTAGAAVQCLTDVCRGTIVCGSFAQIERAVDALAPYTLFVKARARAHRARAHTARTAHGLCRIDSASRQLVVG